MLFQMPFSAWLVSVNLITSFQKSTSAHNSPSIFTSSDFAKLWLGKNKSSEEFVLILAVNLRKHHEFLNFNHHSKLFARRFLRIILEIKLVCEQITECSVLVLEVLLCAICFDWT